MSGIERNMLKTNFAFSTIPKYIKALMFHNKLLISIKAIIYFTHLAFLGASSSSNHEGSTILYCNDHNCI